ncbi:MAG: RNA polymerase sporulation sigma factor SigE [Clostridia bacterium]|nr:RNA polymerase sporulation sigma factor SigE [Clostridia bacterium]
MSILIRFFNFLVAKIKGFFSKKRIKKKYNFGQIYYINGADVLPAPLTREEEAEILSSGDISEYQRNLLIEHNLRLVVYIAKKFENTGINIEDLISIGTVGLMKAINTFKMDKNIKLATYASRCIENEILMYIRKNSAQRREVSFDEPLNVDWDGNILLLSDILGSDADVVCRGIEEDEERAIVRASVETLKKREKLIIQLRFGMLDGKERTQKEVADMLGISQSYISRLEKKIISRLRKEMMGKI